MTDGLTKLDQREETYLIGRTTDHATEIVCRCSDKANRDMILAALELQAEKNREKDQQPRPDRVRKWCACQMKCVENTPATWTCTAHLYSGRAFQCRADPSKVSVAPEGYFRHEGGCTDFEPPGYDRNDPDAYGPVPKLPKRDAVKS